MNAIILAGGLGTRLRAVVNDVPKCMAMINGKPFLFYLLKYLEKFSVNKVILSLGYKSEIVESWIHDFPREQFPLEFSIENTPLGTGGAIKKALEYVDSKDTLVLNGDTFFDIDINELHTQHLNNRADITMALKEMTDFDRYGNVLVDQNSRIRSFEEKKYCKQGQINGGVYILGNGKDLFSDFPDKFSFETDYLRTKMFEKKIYGFIYEDYFIDIGIPKDYVRAQKEFELR